MTFTVQCTICMHVRVRCINSIQLSAKGRGDCSELEEPEVLDKSKYNLLFFLFCSASFVQLHCFSFFPSFAK